ncbi:hypothetical protein B0H19DRAFT_1376809 [Mycena capillaripes]|nr:hypothetical protein B0H19DRAFT_1376809 [Mycena capillaripes]
MPTAPGHAPPARSYKCLVVHRWAAPQFPSNIDVLPNLMTSLVPIRRPGSLKIECPSSGIPMFRNRLPKDQYTTLPPIIELEEPEELEDVLDVLQDIWNTPERLCTSIGFAGIPDLPPYLEFSHAVQNRHSSSNPSKQNMMTPTVEFTSLSLIEESHCAPGPSRPRPPPLRTISNLELRQQHGTNPDEFAKVPLRSACDMNIDPTACESFFSQMKPSTRKRSREDEVDEGRRDIKRQRTLSNHDNSPPPMLVKSPENRPASPPSIVDPNDSGLRRRCIVQWEEISLVARKRSFEEVEQSADEMISDLARYMKRRRLGLVL